VTFFSSQPVSATLTAQPLTTEVTP
jgi:hypothetical protein